MTTRLERLLIEASIQTITRNAIRSEHAGRMNAAARQWELVAESKQKLAALEQEKR
jgi:hypothetical protein